MAGDKVTLQRLLVQWEGKDGIGQWRWPGVKRLMEYAGGSLREGGLRMEWIWGCKEEER